MRFILYNYITFISIFYIYTSTSLYSSYSEHSDEDSFSLKFKKKSPSLPIIDLDKNPALKQYYDENEEEIPSSRSNVRQTGENGEEELGFLAFIQTYQPILQSQNKKKKQSKNIKRKNSVSFCSHGIKKKPKEFPKSKKKK